jgi:hypothetical protein
MNIYKFINKNVIFLALIILLGICIRNFFINIKEPYNNKDTIIPSLTPTAKANIASIHGDEMTQRANDAIMNLKIKMSKGGVAELFGKVKNAEDIKFYNDEKKKIKDLIKNATNNKDKYNYIQLLLDFYNNKDTGWYYWFKDSSEKLQKAINILMKIGSEKFDDAADDMMVQMNNFDILKGEIEDDTTNLEIEAEKLEEIFKKEAAKRRAEYLAKLNIEVEKAQCTTYNYKEFCEKSTDSCTWLGDSCDRFEKNPFPQPTEKNTLV